VWYRRAQAGPGGGVAAAPPDEWEITLPQAAWCFYYGDDPLTGRRRYRSTGSADAATKGQYKDVFMGYTLLVTLNGNVVAESVRRYSSLREWVAELRATALQGGGGETLVEPLPFPQKTLFREGDATKRRLELMAYFQVRAAVQLLTSAFSFFFTFLTTTSLLVSALTSLLLYFSTSLLVVVVWRTSRGYSWATRGCGRCRW
jgi:hypothetical protein